MNKILRANTCFIHRCISTTAVIANGKVAKVFGKLLRKNGLNHNRKWYDYTPPKSDEFVVLRSGPSRTVQRRMNVLNKLLMGHVTDIMSTGEICPDLLNRGIEITYVKITANFNDLHIYWFDKPSNKEFTLETQKLLDKYAPLLRHKLTDLRVLTTMPKIQFLQDKEYKAITELNYRLSIADTGSDTEMNKEEIQTNEDLPSQIPEMRNDVFGLNHTAIMSKIINALNKKGNHISSFKPKEGSMFTNDVAQENSKLLLAEYLRKKKINERKKYQQMKKLMKGKEYEEYSIDETDDDYYDDDNDDKDVTCDNSIDYDDSEYYDDRDHYTINETEDTETK